MKQTYIVLAPVTPKGKFKVCASRAGSKTGFYEIAECPNQTQADTVRSALEAANVRVEETPQSKAA